MKPKKFKYSAVFIRSLKKFPKSQLKSLAKKEAMFRENPFDRRLRTHKLKGKLSEYYSFSISYHWRIVFHFENPETIIFDNIGTHSVYQ